MPYSRVILCCDRDPNRPERRIEAAGNVRRNLRAKEEEHLLLLLIGAKHQRRRRIIRLLWPLRSFKEYRAQQRHAVTRTLATAAMNHTAGAYGLSLITFHAVAPVVAALVRIHTLSFVSIERASQWGPGLLCPHLQVMQPDLLLGAHLLRYFGFADGGFSASRL